MLRLPQRSMPKHTSVFGLSDNSVKIILHTNHHFHPYKIEVVQELLEHDFNSRINRMNA